MAGDPQEGAKQKALIGDPDAVRADGVAAILQRVGFDVEVVRTGRQLIRRLQDKADVDLVLVDNHIVDPLLPDLLPQLRADRRARTLPVLVIASPEGHHAGQPADGPGPAGVSWSPSRTWRENPFLERPGGRQGPLVERTEHSPEEMRRLIVGRHRAQVARMRAAVEKAGFTLTEEMNDRIAYFSLETFSPEMLNAFARELVDEERIIVRRLLPPLVRAELGDAPLAALRTRIRADDLPSQDEAARIVNLMKITAGYEAALPADRLAAFEQAVGLVLGPGSPKLPPMAPVRDPDVEARLARIDGAVQGACAWSRPFSPRPGSRRSWPRRPIDEPR